MYESGCLDPEEYDVFNSTTFSILRTIDELTREKDAKISSTIDAKIPSTSVEISPKEPSAENKRKCKNCGAELTKNSKYQNQCTRCYNKNYAELNKEKLREYHRQKYLANKAQILRDAKTVRMIKKPESDKCVECGIETKLLFKSRCIKCYRLIYKNGDQESFNNVEGSLNGLVPISEPIIKDPKFCQDCGVEITYRTTVNRCKRCNKNFHRRNSRKRVRERNRKPCPTCGVFFKLCPNQLELKCTACLKKEKEEKLLENFDGVSLLNYLSNISCGSSTKLKRIQTNKLRGNCEECGVTLPTRGYLMKCKPCNKRAYKKMIRQRKREANLQNSTDEIGEKSPSTAIKNMSQQIRYCANCPNLLHYLCRGELCRRCNKNRYKREARRRKREKRLAESISESIEINRESEDYQIIQSSTECLNQMVGQIDNLLPNQQVRNEGTS